MPPTILIDALNAVRRRVKALSIAFGVGVVLASAAVAALVIVGLDWVCNFLYLDLKGLPKVVLLLAAAGGLLWAIARLVVRPVVSRLSLSDVAGRLEQAFPIFDDRLRSTVAFLNGHVPGSRVMQDRVVSEATSIATRVNLNRAVVVKPVAWSLSAAVGALALVLGLAMVDKGFTRTALSRLFHPFNGMAWPKRVEIAMDALPDRVPVGQPISLKLHLAKGYRAGAEVALHFKYDNGPEQTQILTAGEDALFAASLDAKGQKLTVWTEAGDDKTEPKTIAILPRLEIKAVQAVVTPPKYTGLPPAAPVDLLTVPVTATVGSDIELRIAFNKPLDAAKPVTMETEAANADLAPGKDEKGNDKPAAKKTSNVAAPTWDRSDPTMVIGHLRAGESFLFRVHATDTDQFANAAIQEYEVVVKPDEMPSVTIELPKRNEDRTPIAAFPVQIAAEDDFGLRTMKLIVDRVGDKDKQRHWEIELKDWQPIAGTTDRPRWRLEWTWDLGTSLLDDKKQPFKLEPGDVLEYAAQVQDNYALESTGPDGKPTLLTHPPVTSGKLRINVVSADQIAADMTNTVRAIAEKTAGVKHTQDRTMEETRQLQEASKNQPELTRGQKEEADKLVNQQTAVASQAKTLAEQLAQVKKTLDENKSPEQGLKDLARDVKDQLDKTAENPMKDAANQLSDAAQQKADPRASKEQQKQQSDARNEQMNQSQANQKEASNQLEKAMAKMSQVGTLQTFTDKFTKNLEKQRDLEKQFKDAAKQMFGKDAKDLTPEEKAKLDKIAAEQKKLGDQTAKDTADMEKAQSQMQKSDQSAAEAMKQAAQQSKDQNISGNQQDAGQQAQQNKRESTQNAQQQAELGLQVVVNTLKEAERRKLEKLRQQLEEAQKQIENLVRRQAGHNVDDLTLQGGEKVKLITEKLMQEAARDPKKPQPAPEAPVLTNSQEQTERNTRDISKTMDDLPGGAEITSALIKAARKMGDAIPELRDTKLAGAYDPHMADALAALEEAKKRVSDQKQNVQQQQDAEKKEAIRQAYIKIKEKHDANSVETAKLDKDERLPTGQLKSRVNDNRLVTGLPADEGKLSDQVKKLDDDLRSLESEVYIWANKDIYVSMDEVKDELAKRSSGQPTQAEQTRISEQLAAMINDLAIKPPKKDDFEKGGGGVGGDGGQPKKKLPTEAELRLLKDLQLAVNKNTPPLDAQIKAKPDDKGVKEKLNALGGRQGQLRGVLDRLLKKASNGQMGLNPPPDKDEKLPEEASDEQIDNQETDKGLLNDDERKIEDKATKDAGLIGDRMARVQKRVGDDYDPGKTTQKIEDRIVANMDDLIQLARQQSQQSSGKPKPGQGEPQPGDQPGDAQAQKPGNSNGQQQGQQQQNSGATPAGSDQANNGGVADAKMDPDIKERAEEWGRLHPGRLHDAVVEGSSEQIISKYKALVEDYYRTLSIKAGENK